MIRDIAPTLAPIEAIELIAPKVKKYTNGLELVWMKDVEDETVRFELHFNAGSIQGDLLVAGLTNALLLSGTKDKNTTQIHDAFAQLGAYVDVQTGTESAVIAVFCLRENLNEALEILIDAIENVIFPESEFIELIQDRKQLFLVNSKKMNMLARRSFAKHFFQNDLRYGRTAELEDYDKVQLNTIVEFHQAFYLKGLVRVLCVANLEESFLDTWCERFSRFANKQEIAFINEVSNQEITLYEEKEDAVQTAIRIGFPLFNKTARDYAGMYVLQTILGDYFGSRLMSNLREDKGYTYGIGSGILEMRQIGYLIIATEVKKESREDSLKQIKYEIQRLKEELVSDDELELVQNYLLGQFLKSADGSDAMTELFMTTHPFGLDLNFYNDFVAGIKNCTSTELRDLAIKYLDIEKATIIQIG